MAEYREANFSFVPTMSTPYGPGIKKGGVVYYQSNRPVEQVISSPKVYDYNFTTGESREKSREESRSDGGGYDVGEIFSSLGLPRSEKSNLLKKFGASNSLELYNIIREKEERERREREERLRKEISSAWEPIFSELDRQIGLIPIQKQKQQAGLEELVGLQREEVGRQEEAGVRTLEAQKEEQKQLAKKSFRELEEDIRNQMMGASQILGVRGAGDSSAAYDISEIINRAATKARGGIIETRNQIFNEIGLKIQEVHDLAATNINKINQYKTEKLMEIEQFFTDQLNRLSMTKAEARSQRGMAIANMIQNLESEFANALRQLDQQVLNYAQSVEMWEMQRAAELENVARTMQQASNVSFEDKVAKYQEYLEAFDISPEGAAAMAGMDEDDLSKLRGQFGALPSLREEEAGPPKTLQVYSGQGLFPETHLWDPSTRQFVPFRP